MWQTARTLSVGDEHTSAKYANSSTSMKSLMLISVGYTGMMRISKACAMGALKSTLNGPG
jgi:hypothetical protein